MSEGYHSARDRDNHIVKLQWGPWCYYVKTVTTSAPTNSTVMYMYVVSTHSSRFRLGNVHRLHCSITARWGLLRARAEWWSESRVLLIIVSGPVVRSYACNYAGQLSRYPTSVPGEGSHTVPHVNPASAACCWALWWRQNTLSKLSSLVPYTQQP